MGKKIYKLLAVMLAIVICIVMMPAGAVFAADDNWKLGDTIYWDWNNDVVTVTGYGAMYDFDNNGKNLNYYTPAVSEYDYHPHGWRAHDYTIAFSSQTDKITYIGDYAFCGYNFSATRQDGALKGSIYLPKAVRRIGDYAFYYDKINEAKMNDALESIESYAFAYCKELTTLVLNKNLSSIGNYAFAYCEQLPSLVLNDNLKSIGEYAFSGDKNIAGNLTIPESVSGIGRSAFMGCSALDGSLVIREGTALKTIPEECFKNTGFTGTLAIPDGIEEIKANAFTNTCIETLYIPKSVTSIDKTAFGSDNFLKKIYFEGSQDEWTALGGSDVTGFTGITPNYNSSVVYCRATFNADGGTAVADQTVVEGEKLKEPVTEREGYTFEGWFDENGRKWDFDNDVLTKDITLKARWSKIVEYCTVTFELNNGYDPVSVTAVKGEEITYPALERIGYSLEGWYDEDGNKWDTNNVVVDDITLTAKWVEKYCKVTLNANGGSINGDEKLTVQEGEGISMPSVNKDGYTLEGWYDKDGKKWDFDKDKVYSDMTLTAKWTDSGEAPYTEDVFYTITTTAGEGGSISPEGSVKVGEGTSKTFTISASEGYHISYIKVDGETVGAISSYTFYDIYENHNIEAYFIAGGGFCVHFETYDSTNFIPDQYITSGGLVGRPVDPEKTGYEFKDWFLEPTFEHVWDFGKETVTSDMTLYAYFVAIDKSTTDFYLLSSTKMLGKWIDTVIGQGCTVKLSLANSDGKKLKGIDKKSIQWKIAPYYSDGTKAEDYFSLVNGKLKCNKDAPTGYTAMVTATYDNKTVYYIVTVIKKISKMGYVDSAGSFRSSLTVKVSSGSKCDFGYGPHQYLKETGKYVAYYDKGNGRIGTALYRQPNGRSWHTYGYTPEQPVYYCSATLPKKASISIRDAWSRSSNSYYPLYYFNASKGSYAVTYIAPDGSGKKFKVTFKVAKPH